MSGNSRGRFRALWFFPLAAFLLLFPLASARTQEPQQVERDSTFWIFQRKPLVTYTIGAYSAYVLYKEWKWWWRDNSYPWMIRSEGFLNNYSLGVDKVGHFYTSYLYTTSFRELMVWGGFEPETALWFSVGIAAFHAVSIEIGDGFSTYHFAPDDLLANFLGITYGYLQTGVPFLRNINPKWSYYPSGNAHFKKSWHITGDYDGHIYWLSFNIHDLLPRGARNYWPEFLSLAVGYGGKNISQGASGIPARKFAISLDYNLLAIPTPGDTWDMIKRVLNPFHFPAPGVKFINGEPAQFKPILLF